MRHTISAVQLAAAAFVAAAVPGAAGGAAAQSTTVAQRDDNVVEARALPAVVTRAAPEPVWTGEMSGPSPGQILLTLDRVGMPDDPLDPVWPLSAHWTFTATRRGQSFTAELYGIGRENGAMHLRGVIIDGYRQGSEVQLDVERAGGGAKLLIYPLRDR